MFFLFFRSCSVHIHLDTKFRVSGTRPALRVIPHWSAILSLSPFPSLFVFHRTHMLPWARRCGLLLFYACLPCFLVLPFGYLLASLAISSLPPPPPLSALLRGSAAVHRCLVPPPNNAPPSPSHFLLLHFSLYSPPPAPTLTFILSRPRCALVCLLVRRTAPACPPFHSPVFLRRVEGQPSASHQRFALYIWAR